MAHNSTVLGQFLKLVSRHEFEREARRHHRGRKLRSMSRWGQFVAMATAQLSGRRSLRDIVSNLDAQAHKLYHLGVGRVARSSLARVNREQPHELYEGAVRSPSEPLSGGGAGAWVPFPEQAVVARRHVRGPVPEGVSLGAVPQDQGGVEAARGSRPRGLSAVVPARHRRQGLGPRGGPVASSSEGEHRGGGPVCTSTSDG